KDHGGDSGGVAALAARGQLCRLAVGRGRERLRGDGALPHQFVQAALVVGEEARHLRGRAQRGGGSQGFVRFLRVLRVGGVEVGFVRQRGGAEVAREHVADLAQRLGRQVDRVGTQVAGQADAVFLAYVPALI